MDRPDAALRDALLAAKYAGLASRAQTAQSRRLVQEVFEHVVAGDQGGRGPYAGTHRQMLLVTEGLLGDLLRAAGHGEARGWVYRPLQKQSFSGEEVGARSFKRVLDRFKQLDLIEQQPHFRQFTNFDPGGPPIVRKSLASRFRATQKLLALAAEHGVPVDQAADHFVVGLPEYPLVLRATSTREAGEKQRGKLMDFPRTEETDRLLAEVVELNEFLDQFTLYGGKHRGYLRVFNCGDAPDFAWNMGGRLYSNSSNEDTYQHLSQQERLRMTINNEPVVEIDIKASYLTIFLAEHGGRLDPSRDPYVLAGLREDSRDIVKKLIVRMWGSDGRTLRRWPSDMIEEYREESGGGKLGTDYPLKAIQAKVLETYPAMKLIARHTNVWARLMYRESEAVITTMLRLKREHGVPCLTVHDSLIVPLSKKILAQEILSEQYHKTTGVQPLLVTRQQ